MTEAKTAGSEPGQQDARLLFDHYLDHPKQGVSFWGVSRFLSRPELHEIRTVTLGNLAKQVQEWRATKIACLDSRGYLVGGMIVGALHASSVVGLVPVMKRGKLPESAKGTLVSSQYVTEYSRVDGLVIAAGAITDTDRVVVVDDLVATGGTLDNLIDLIHSTTKAKVVGALTLIEVTGLGDKTGRSLLKVPFGASFVIPAGSTLVSLDQGKRLGALTVTGDDRALIVPCKPTFDTAIVKLNTMSSRELDALFTKGMQTVTDVVGQKPISASEDKREEVKDESKLASDNSKTTLFLGAAPKQLVLSRASVSVARIIVLCWPTMQPMADRMVREHPDVFELRPIGWNFFPDKTPNFTFPADLKNRHVVFVGSAFDLTCWSYQLWIMKVIGDQRVKSFFMCLPFFPTGTMEIVPKEGVLATAQTMATDFLSMTPTKSGPPELLTYDFHALPIYHYFDAQKVHVQRGLTASTLLVEAIKTMVDMPPLSKIVLVLPDNGAEKRFASHFDDVCPGTVVCIKKRVGDKREIDICREPNFDWTKCPLLLRDDLVQSGSTLVECAQLLRKRGAKLLYAFVTHAVFPNRSFEAFVEGGKHHGLFTKFFVTDSIPETTIQIAGREPFCVLPLAGDISKQVLSSLEWPVSTVETQARKAADADSIVTALDSSLQHPATFYGLDGVSPPQFKWVDSSLQHPATLYGLDRVSPPQFKWVDSSLQQQQQQQQRPDKGDAKSLATMRLDNKSNAWKDKMLPYLTRDSKSRPLNVFVASKSIHKVTAVRRALQHVFGHAIVGSLVNLHEIETDSKVHRQPIDEETGRGCSNRMIDLLSRLAISTEPFGFGLCISMENGFNSCVCGDFAEIRVCRSDRLMCKRPGTETIYLISTPVVQVPLEIGQALQDDRKLRGDKALTIGEVIQLKRPTQVKDPTNWQALYHPEGLDRTAILTKALIDVLENHADALVESLLCSI